MTIEEGNEIIWQYMHPGVVDNRPEAKLPPYDIDWNWLIPVVIAIRDSIGKTKKYPLNIDMLLVLQNINEAVDNLNRKTLWAATIEAIQLLKQLQ